MKEPKLAATSFYISDFHMQNVVKNKIYILWLVLGGSCYFYLILLNTSVVI
jgi:hypothetical protein